MDCLCEALFGEAISACGDGEIAALTGSDISMLVVRLTKTRFQII
jgi:hypothetical protein